MLVRFVDVLWVSTGNYFVGLKDDGSVWKASVSPTPLVWMEISPLVCDPNQPTNIVGFVETSRSEGYTSVYAFEQDGTWWRCRMSVDSTSPERRLKLTTWEKV